MERFYDVVGYVVNEETSPGTYSGVTVSEKKYYGDVKRVSRRWEKTENLNDDLVVNHNIEIIADAYAYDHFFAIKYVRWKGVYWKVTSVDVLRPRLVLSLGGVYNGITSRSSECS